MNSRCERFHGWSVRSAVIGLLAYVLWPCDLIAAAPPEFLGEQVFFRENGTEEFASEWFHAEVQYRCWIRPIGKNREVACASLFVRCDNFGAISIAKPQRASIEEFSISLDGIKPGDVFPICGLLYKTIKVEHDEKPLGSFVELRRVDPTRWGLPAVIADGTIVYPLGDFDTLKSWGLLGGGARFGMRSDANEVPRRRAVMRYIAVDEQRRIVDEERIDEIDLLCDSVFELKRTRYRVVQVVHPKSVTKADLTTRIVGWVAISPVSKETPVTAEPHPWSRPKSFVPTQR